MQRIEIKRICITTGNSIKENQNYVKISEKKKNRGYLG